MIGQGIVPEKYHPVANDLTDDELRQFLIGYRASIEKAVEKLPMQADFLKKYCPVDPQ